jgi:hypothetical protein
VLQISGVGQDSATLTAYRTAEGCKIAVGPRHCDEANLIAELSQAPHRCDHDEAHAIAGLVRAHQARCA